MANLGARNLPKYLVKAIGKDTLVEIINPVKPKVVHNRVVLPKNRRVELSKLIERYPVEEAIEKAKLP